MKDFLLIFRMDKDNPQPSPDQMQSMMKVWQDWMGGLAAQNKLVNGGNRLAHADAAVVRANNMVTNGPFAEIKEAVGGYIVIRAADVAEATELSKGCPILQGGGSVEVRTIIPM